MKRHQSQALSSTCEVEEHHPFINVELFQPQMCSKLHERLGNCYDSAQVSVFDRIWVTIANAVSYLALISMRLDFSPVFKAHRDRREVVSLRRPIACTNWTTGMSLSLGPGDLLFLDRHVKMEGWRNLRLCFNFFP